MTGSQEPTNAVSNQLAPPVTQDTLRKAHNQNIANLIKKLPDGKTLSKAEQKELQRATQRHPADHQTALAALADDLPAELLRELANPPELDLEKGKSIFELRQILQMAILDGDISLALSTRKELNKLQGLYPTRGKGDMDEFLENLVKVN